LIEKQPKEQTNMSFRASHKVIAIALSLLIIGSTAAQQQRPPYLDTSLPLDQRVDDLVSRMTLEEKVSQMMNAAPAIPRLGITEYDWWNEALHGVAFGVATVFPQAIGLGATFDPQLINRVSTVISEEARAKYHEAQRHGNRSRFNGLTFWSPNINIRRACRIGDVCLQHRRPSLGAHADSFTRRNRTRTSATGRATSCELHHQSATTSRDHKRRPHSS
jgi:beta-glucosidase-like glycosyl hydrolase